MENLCFEANVYFSDTNTNVSKVYNCILTLCIKSFFRGLLAFARILVSQLKKRKRLFNFNVGQTLTAQDKTLISLAAGFKEKRPAPVIVNILSPITSANHCHPPTPPPPPCKVQGNGV